MKTDALLSWYAEHARDLPWRRTSDPWAILVSEVMLQQTQAARVVPYYERFLARFPTPAACAAAPAADVLRLWSGLGYNRRGLALHRAAGIVAADGWPEDLTELPGVGSYTAAAVGSFAWGRRVLTEDTNVRRVLARTGAEIREPEPVLNQALMELGATICTARAPACDACPVCRRCAGPEEIAAAPGVRGRASRTPTATSAGASWRRSRPGDPCPPWPMNACKEPSTGSSATA